MINPPYDNRGTFNFQSPTGADEPGKGYPFELSNDAGILKNGYLARIVSKTLDSIPALGNNLDLDTEDESASYATYTQEQPVPYDPNDVLNIYPIRFFENEVVNVIGTGIQGSNPLYCNFLGEVTSVDMPSYLATDEYQPIANISIKNIYTINDQTLGFDLDNWTVMPPDAVVENNFVQNENLHSKNAVGHYGSATFIWPKIYYSEDPPNPLYDESGSQDSGYQSYSYTYTYDGWYWITPDDKRNRPWTDVTVGVAHIKTTFVVTTIYNNVVKSAWDGAQYVETTISEDSSRVATVEEINQTYTFNSDDYENQNPSDPESTKVPLNETYVEGRETYREEINLNGNNYWFITEIVDTYVYLGDKYDFNVYPNTLDYPGPNVPIYPVKDGEPGITYATFHDWWTYTSPQFDYNSPYYPQHPTTQGSVYYLDPAYNPETGDAPFYTSDKFSYPDPSGFFSPPNP